jgi:class 3 adenylate cyclase/tetratricopeptide (TPR) repeat protein
VERKLATVLFADLVDSTGLVAGSDPEVARGRVTQFLDRIGDCVEAHGGTVGRFAGDSVMAVFGIPQTHEDDAIRAVRAGFAILESVRELELQARIGLESGEVVSDEADLTFATGEAINVAVRLQQEASPSELLIGPGTHRLTLGAIETEELGPLELRGIESPVWARRVLCTAEESRPVSVASPLVGRTEEIDLLHNTFSRVARDGRAHVFTIYGEPGLGKSRLAREFLEGLEGATVLFGRALPYGEGITYWPVAEMVKVAAGITDDDPVKEAVEKLRASCEDEAIADLLGLASGVLEAVEGERSQQEIAWAVREWAERLAGVQPLVLLFEDIHWAEEPLLELIEHLAAWVRDAPLLLLCLARPELLDVRPGWGAGRVRSTSIELEALAPEEVEEMLVALVDRTPLQPEDVTSLIEKTGGNPLFIEETIRMLVEQDGAGAAERIPDTVQALIAARIDRLPAEHRTLLRRAAVVGRTFWAGAMAQLSPDLDVEPIIEDLLLRDFLIQENRSSISGETAYRFKHVLIREVACGGLSKSERADHHKRFAAWLKERAGEELLEVRAYHLDHAATLVAELEGAAPAELAAEAAAALEEAGRRAFAREANSAARRLFLSALELEPNLERRYQAARAAWRITDYPVVSREMEEVCAAAEAEGLTEIQGRALIALAEAAVVRDADVPRAERLVEKALDVLDRDDKVARFDALSVRGTIAWTRGDLSTEERVMEEALELARETARKDLESEVLDTLASVYAARMEFERAQPLADRALALAEESGSAATLGRAHRFRGQLFFHRGALDEAESELELARTYLAEAGAAWALGRTLNFSAWVAWRKGEPARAERLFRESIRILAPLEDRATLCESQRSLAQLLIEQGKLDEAERLALAARQTVGPQDLTSLATTAMALGLVRAAQGKDEEAEQLLREAHATIAETDHRRHEVETLEGLTQFLRERAREPEAASLEERRGELVSAASSAARIA